MKRSSSPRIKRLTEIVLSMFPISLYCLDIACGVGGSGQVDKTPTSDRLNSGTYVAACHPDAALTAAISARSTFWKSTATIDRTTSGATIVHEGFLTSECTNREIQLTISADFLLEDREESFLVDLRLDSRSTYLTPLTDDATAELNTTKICGFTYVKSTPTAIADATCDQQFIFASGHSFWSVMKLDGSNSFTLGKTFSLDANQISTELNDYKYNAQ